MNPHYPAVAERAGHRCEYCRAPEALFNFPFEVEHITPIGAGEPDTDSNLALACRACNVFKSDHTQWTDPNSDLAVDLFHPCRQRWEDHFLVDEQGTVFGITPVGRATVALLKMNSPNQRTARRHWIRLEVYP